MQSRSARRVIALSIIALLALLVSPSRSLSPAMAQDKPAPKAKPVKPEKPDNAVNLPVTKAVLFSSGVGYFEHAGTVNGNASLQLMFKKEQINDVLKSMVLMDLDGGQVASVSYGSKEPLERALKSFGVDISAAPTLPQLLQQLRGAVVTVEAPDKMTGKILSVEEKVRVVGDPPAQITEFTLTLVTDAGIRTVNLSNVQSLTLADPKLQDELNQALSLLSDSRDQDRKPVEIRFAGEGERRVRVGYLIETPIWKTTYRLDLSEEKPLLQGWAIVENTSDADWQDVALSLVAGRPISFIQDLYTPLYVPRPVVQPKLYASLVPPDYAEGLGGQGQVVALEQEQMRKAEAFEGRDGALRDRAMAEADFAGAPPAAPAAARPSFAGGRGGVEKAKQSAVALNQGVLSVADAGDLGELFEFTIAHPVDLTRRRSAMLPILNKNIDAEKVSIYNQASLPKHPLNGVWLTNSSGMKLLAGPVTVFDDGAYAGDARIDDMTQGEKRLLGYSVDLAVTVDPSISNASAITGGKIVRGVLYVSRMNTWSQTYRIKNKAAEKRTLVIEHPFINGRDLVQPDAPAEKTPELYRFRVPVEADTTGEFIVKEQQVDTQTIAIINTPPGTILAFVNANEIPKPVRDSLAQAAAMKQEIDRLQQILNQKRNELAQVQQGQERLRQNIATVGQDSTLGKRYLAKLSAEEDQIEKLQTEITQLQNTVNQKNDELAKFVNALNVGT